MNEYEYIYTKQRKEFGKHCSFENTEPKLLGHVEGNTDISDSFLNRNPVDTAVETAPLLSSHTVNTERVKSVSRGQVHVEGGWPKEIDGTDAQDTSKWRKRLDKDPVFASVVKSLYNDVEQYLDQNKTLDMFEHYFDGEEVEQQMQSLQCVSTALYKDKSGGDDKRAVSRISWHPEGPHKFLASYSVMRFQSMSDTLPRSSFIWETESPNMPVFELITPSPLICSHFQPKNTGIVGGGAYNGLVMYFDVRQGSKPVAQSPFDVSHADPIYDFAWLQSKTNSECVTTSTDGKVIWWDVRNLEEPLEELQLVDPSSNKILGGTCVEWMQEAGPTKYLVGTEQGLSLSLNRKPKKAVEVGGWFGFEDKGGGGKHTGPVYSIKRNPQHVKYFMTVGDWSVKLWLEELKAPLLQTQFSPSFLTCGGWSPTRPGVFFAGREDGMLDFWDYYYRMNELAYSHKVSSASVSCAHLQSQGRLMAVGDTNGTISLLELCDELVQPAPNEKVAVGTIFERETRRERSLEAGKKQAALARSSAPPREKEGKPTEAYEKSYLSRETTWYESLGIEPEDRDYTQFANAVDW